MSETVTNNWNYWEAGSSPPACDAQTLLDVFYSDEDTFTTCMFSQVEWHRTRAPLTTWRWHGLGIGLEKYTEDRLTRDQR